MATSSLQLLSKDIFTHIIENDRISKQNKFPFSHFDS